MAKTGRFVTDSNHRVDTLLLFRAIIEDPGSLEAGLRLLTVDRVQSQDAYVAWGLDRIQRPVVVYVTGATVERRQINEALTPWIDARSTSPSKSRSISDDAAGRVLAIATDFGAHLRFGPPVVFRDWEVELLLWNGAAQTTDEILLESLEATNRDGVGAGDSRGEESEAPSGDADPPGAGRARLTPEEIESLVGSWPPCSGGGPA